MLMDVAHVQTEERGVLYLGRIPHGFFEDEMRAYFTQFGDVTRLRLSRNKRVRLAQPFLKSDDVLIAAGADRRGSRSTTASSSSRRRRSRGSSRRRWTTTC